MRYAAGITESFVGQSNARVNEEGRVDAITLREARYVEWTVRISFTYSVSVE
jgi:hypothetical protein